MSSPVPLHLWPRNRSTAWRCDVPGKAVLNVLPQSRVCQQFGSLGSPCGAVGMPLRRVSTVLQSAATSGCISSQLARDRRGGAPELPGNLPDTFATGSRQRNLLTLSICDNGRGVQAADRLKPQSFGLRGMSERASALGGTLALSSAPGGGTMVTIKTRLASQAGVARGAPEERQPASE